MMQDWVPEMTTDALGGSFGEPCLLRYEIEYLRLRSMLPAAQRINGFCLARARVLERFACSAALAEARRQQGLLGKSFRMLEVTASVQVMRCGGGLLSGFADGCRQLGARGTRLTRVSRTFDLKTGREISLPELFKQGTPWNERIFTALEAELVGRAASEPGSYYKNAANICRHRLASNGYYLADDGLAIWYPQETMAPGNTGIPTFMIRFDNLRDLLRWEL